MKGVWFATAWKAGLEIDPKDEPGYAADLEGKLAILQSGLAGACDREAPPETLACRFSELRPDEIQPSFSCEELLESSSCSQEGFLLLPGWPEGKE